MNSDTYETDIVKFDKYEESINNLFDRKHPDELKKIMVTMTHLSGLSGEVGELCEKIKKSIRDKGGIEYRNPAILKELGDIEWYLTRIMNDLGYTKNEVLQENYDKLSKRLEENKIHGEGDDR